MSATTSTTPAASSTIFSPHNYQKHAIEFGLDRQLRTRGSVGYFLDPGLGKTSISLTLLKCLKQFADCGSALVIAPLRVIYSVWPAECRKWQQFHKITTSIIHGTAAQRVKALNTPADIHLINPDGVTWLTRYLMEEAGHPTDMPPGRWATLIRNKSMGLASRWSCLIVDESSQFKSPKANRTKALHSWSAQFSRRSILTGTPAPNGLIDLWAQVYLLDGGESLGKNVTAYRNRYFYKEGGPFGKWLPKAGSHEAIYKAITHLVLRLSAADHLDLPPLVENDIWVELPRGRAKAYRKLERELFVEIEDGGELVIGSAGAKYAACRGYANGGLYETIGDTRTTHHVHDVKVDALLELIGELQGKPLLVAYQFNHDLERMQKRLKGAPTINGKTTATQSNQIISDWNAGRIPLLMVQPQALSHGVNMQASGNDVAWFGLTDNLETYLQFNARIYRQGVSGQVRVHRILARGTVDEAVRQRIESKDETQQALLRALQAYRKKSHLSEDVKKPR